MYLKDPADVFINIVLKKERNSKDLRAKREMQVLRVLWVLLEKEEILDQSDLPVISYLGIRKYFVI